MRGAIGAALRRVAGCPRIVRRGAGLRSEIALTFDDGPSEWTPEIARALAGHGCRGTFFVRGAAAEREPGAIADLVDAGHEVGNHLFSHADPSTQTLRALRREVEATALAVATITGRPPPLVRPPYCGAPERVAWAARQTRFVVLRSVDPADWRATSPEVITGPVLESVGPGDIICLHDGLAPTNRGSSSREATVAAVELLLPELLERGLRLVTVSELLR